MNTLVGKYLGKTLKKTGTKKDGNAYTMFKATFECNFNGNVKPVNVTVFDSCKGLTEVQEGKMYEVGYKSNPYTLPDGKEVQLKTALYIKPSEGTTQQPVQQQASTNPSGPVPEICKVDNFFAVYKKKFEFKQMSNFHALGVYVSVCDKYNIYAPAVCSVKAFNEAYNKHIDKDLGPLEQ